MVRVIHAVNDEGELGARGSHQYIIKNFIVLQDTDILVTMMHTLHWVQGLLLKESGDEFKKQLPPNLVENLGEIVSNDDTFFIEVGQVSISSFFIKSVFMYIGYDF